MPKHTPRTIWKPVYSQAGHDTNTLASLSTFFTSIRSVDADASMGLVLKRISMTVILGQTSAQTLDNDIHTAGFMGYFKWPIDAATPTDATIDTPNRSSIISRTPYCLMGDNTQRHTVRMKSARLKLGEELWFFNTKMFENATDTDSEMTFLSQHWETQA